ncbi:MAG TPA: PilT/PilU family type 4a pilus ATPase [Gammaproteobacteria bacterium]|nr:PilT/PilU family type 4a pilus ATPase [Gammaproteobacteria bacterium]
MRLRSYFRLMREQNASDLYITANAQIKLRVDGRIRSVGHDVVDAKDIEVAATSMMNEYQLARFRDEQQLDFAVEDPESGRFRFNVFRQRGMTAVVIRYIPAEIPALENLRLPPYLQELALTRRGLVLVVGATGAGKSTTLAAMIDYRNKERADHIITVEDPIEYTYSHRRSIINQRELVTDTPSYSMALRSALRGAPDVVLVGEIRDRETMDAAMELANSGHLCLSTMHTTNAHQTLDRILNMYPELMHHQVLLDMGASLRAVISQRLVRGKDEKRLPAVEVMVNTPRIAELIQQGDLGSIAEAMEESRETGMQTFDSALIKLYKEGLISLDEALSNADSRANLEARIHFG